MCGITGIYNPAKNLGPDGLQGLLQNMTIQLTHRGPDAEGIWHDEPNGIGFGHRRLSIIDLAPTGAQPMHANNQRWTIAFNGEIYNFPDLRTQLDYPYKGSSDTEVILAALTIWGLEKTLKKLNGMFAMSIWDNTEKVLYLARDRIGKKPLYWTIIDQTLYWSSELKSFMDLPGFNKTIDMQSLGEYLKYGYVPGTKTIFKNVFKLAPAHYLTINNNLNPNITAYWSVQDSWQNPINVSENDAIQQLHTLLKDAVKSRLLSDVPLGAFLSGGVDSSTVVALMQQFSTTPAKTFSIGFNETGYDEAKIAKNIANHLGTNHTELYVTPEDARAVIPKLPDIFDEPFADSSQIPTYLVAKLARENVTVALSGDGGDELFAGYSRYHLANKIYKRLGWLPNAAKQLGAKVLHGIPDSAYLTIGLNSDRIAKGAELLTNANENGIYEHLFCQWKNLDTIMIQPTLVPDLVQETNRNYISQLQATDQQHYLPDDILTKVDRTSMAVSLEARCPLLDYRVVEFANQLPLSLKIKNGQSKWLLRQILHQYVPAEIINQKKQGFGVPIHDWLRGPLQEWASDLLSESRLQHAGYLRPDTIQKTWQEHLSGQREWHYKLWTILMFEAWRDRWNVS